MAYDEQLAGRIRTLLGERPGVSERKMFGGIGFMLGGHMCCAVIGDELMLRLGGEGAAEALKRPDVRPMDLTGRPMGGWVLVDPAGLEDDGDLARWVDEGAALAASLPPKP